MHGQDLIGCCSLYLIVVEMVWPKLSNTRLVGCDEHRLCATP